MAIIQSYPITHNIKASDLLLGVANISSTERPEYITTSFRIGDIAASASTITTSYGQLFYNGPAVPIVFNQYNVWQPLGLVATLSSPSRNFSLGLTDKFALKNTSGNSITATVILDLKCSFYGTMAQPIVALAINGNVINNSSTFIWDTGYQLSWVVEMQDGDEVSPYIKGFGAYSTNSFGLAKMMICQA